MAFTRSETLAEHARRAYQQGHTVFTPFIDTNWKSIRWAAPVGGWAEQIEAIEAEGWHLEHWTVSRDGKDAPQAFPLFRRR